jgi:hypothetical protein
MKSIGASWLMLMVAGAMMVSCEHSENHATNQRTTKQGLGGCEPFNCGSQTNLTTTAATSVELGSNFVMIPRTRWDQLIAEQSGNLGALQATNEARQQAVRAASIANDPMASGVFSTDPTPQTEGGNFAVSVPQRAEVKAAVCGGQSNPRSSRM